MSSSVFAEVERLRVRVANLEKKVERLVGQNQENDWDSSWESSSMEC